MPPVRLDALVQQGRTRVALDGPARLRTRVALDVTRTQQGRTRVALDGPAQLRTGDSPGRSWRAFEGKRHSELYAAAGHHGWLHQQGRTGVGNPRKRTLGLHAAPPTRLRSEASSIGGSRPCSKGRWMEYRRRALSSLLVAARV